MKRIAVFGLFFVAAGLLMLVALFSVSVQAPLTWSIEIVDSTGDVSEFSSIALDSGDNPHISYQDFRNGYLKYARRV